jgi:hypothetical protein
LPFIIAIVTSILGAIFKIFIRPENNIQKEFGKIIMKKNYEEIEEQ